MLVVNQCPSAPKISKIMGGSWSGNKDDSSDDSSFDEESDIEKSNSRRNSTHEKHPQPLQQQSSDVSDNICLDSATDTVDAAPPTAAMSITLTLDQVMIIENELELYEKISIMYLLCDDPDSALKQLSILQNGGDDKIVYNWAISQNLTGLKWQEKLVEALCIIQNYKVLSGLGFKQEDLRVRFLPHHSFTFVYVNKIRKALYFVCEGLVQSEVQQLLDSACPDFQRKGFSFKFHNSQYLELYFLHWETIGYLSQNNLSNLCSLLKQVDQLDLAERLKELVPVTQNRGEPSTQKVGRSMSKTMDTAVEKQKGDIFENILNPNFRLNDLVSLESHISADNAVYVSPENKYCLDSKNPGVCLIINQENFYREIDKKLQHLFPPTETKLESRLGTLHDKEKLVATFKKFGFQTVTFDNLIHSDIVKRIEEVIQSITNESSLFICIMSHGDEGVVYGVNSCRVNVSTIKNLMCGRNRQNLSGKPKVLILQACQGTTCQRISATEDDDNITTDGPSSPVREAVPPRADLFTFWATVPGYGAIRNKKTGSWFIQSLCGKMIELGNKFHFEDICTSVIMDVSSKKWDQVKDQVAMVPMKDSTFRKLLYLPPVRN